MRPEAHLSVAAAEVREAPLAKHAGEKLGSATFGGLPSGLAVLPDPPVPVGSGPRGSSRLTAGPHAPNRPPSRINPGSARTAALLVVAVHADVGPREARASPTTTRWRDPVTTPRDTHNQRLLPHLR